MTRARLLLAVAAIAGCASEPARVAHRPESPAAWSQGMTSPAGAPSVAPAGGGIVLLRAPAPSRVPLPGGTFTMGSTQPELRKALELCTREPLGEQLCLRDLSFVPGLLRFELEAHAVTLSPFSIDRTEVPVAEYDRCISAGACSAPSFARGDLRFDQPAFPITHVTWQDANAYCAWAGGRLPTEAEWEYAARGGKLARTFPWGNQWASRRANHGALALDETDDSDGYAGLAPVDAFLDGATANGVLNMAGNVSEWVRDYFDRTTEVGYPRTPVTNPKGSETGEHLVRGGSYRTGAIFLRTAVRVPMIARPFSDDIGFRCAFD